MAEQLPVLITKMSHMQIVRLAKNGTFGKRIVLTEKTNNKIQNAIDVYESLEVINSMLQNISLDIHNLLDGLRISAKSTKATTTNTNNKTNNIWKSILKKFRF